MLNDKRVRIAPLVLVMMIALGLASALAGCGSVNQQFVGQMDVVADRAIPKLGAYIDADQNMPADQKAAWGIWLRYWRNLVTAAEDED